MRSRRLLLLRTGTALGLIAFAGRSIVGAQGNARIIPVTARKFSYEPALVTLKVGEPVIFRLKTEDVVMGFNVPEFGVRATLIPGQTIDLPLTPTKPGEFAFLCDVFCGSGHESMEGMLRVTA